LHRRPERRKLPVEGDHDGFGHAHNGFADV
jgi:hypothetical protein